MNFQQFVDAVSRGFWGKPTYTNEEGVQTQSLLSAALDVSRRVGTLDAVLAMIAEAAEDPLVNVDRFGEHGGPSGDTMLEYQQVVLATAAQVWLTADAADQQAIADEERKRLGLS